jgi:hypothetical protein
MAFNKRAGVVGDLLGRISDKISEGIKWRMKKQEEFRKRKNNSGYYNSVFDE